MSEFVRIPIGYVKGPKGDPGTNGNDGIGIASIVQTQTSHESGGENIVTVTMDDENQTQRTFSVFNGLQGERGEQGPQGKPGISGVPENLHGIFGYSASGSPVELYRTTKEEPGGANLFDAEIGSIDANTGLPFVSTDHIRTANFIQNQYNDYYITQQNGTSYIRLYAYTEDKTFISSMVLQFSFGHFSKNDLPSGTKFLKFALTGDMNTEPMLNEGSVALPYEPYIPLITELTPAPDNTPLNSLEVLGSSKQVKSTGANIYDISLAENNRFQNYAPPYYIVINTGIWITGFIPVKPNTTYASSYNFASGVFYDANKQPLRGSAKSHSTFQTLDNEYYVVFNVASAQVPFKSINIMINEGATALPYEPYTSGLPSPSPDVEAPIEIPGWVCKGHQLLDINLDTMKSLNTAGTWNGNVYTYNNLTMTFYEDGTFLANGATTGTVSFYFQKDSFVNTLKGQKVHISGCAAGGSVGTYRLQLYTSAGSIIDTNGQGSWGTVPTNYAEGLVGVIFYGGITATNLLFRPMLQRYTPKNLIDLSGVSDQTISGIPFTVDKAKGTITAGAGTATANAAFIISESESLKNLKGQTVHISGCPNGGDMSSYRLQLFNDVRTIRDFGEGNTDVVPTNITRADFSIVIASGTVITTPLVFTPRLVKGDHAVPDPKPYPFEPFGSGCNLFEDDPDTNGRHIQPAGSLSENGGWIVSKYIPVDPNKKYYYKHPDTSAGMCFYTENKTYISGITLTQLLNDYNSIVPVPANARYVRASRNTSTVTQPMFVELPFSHFPYSPYRADGGNVRKFNVVKSEVRSANLLKNIATSQTIGNVTFTVNPDKSVTVNTNGPANTPAYFYLEEYDDYISLDNHGLTIGENYYIKGCPSGGSASTYATGFRCNNTDNIYDIGSGVNFTANQNTKCRFCILIGQGTTANNLTFRPMLTKAEFADIPYQPYGSSIHIPTPTGLPAIPLPDNATDYTYVDAEGKKWLADTRFYDGEKVWRYNRVGFIPSYSNETISGAYISSMGELSSGATVYYALATPTMEEETDPDIIQAVMSLHTNKDYTRIETSDYNGMKCYQDVDYYVDKRTPVEKRADLQALLGRMSNLETAFIASV